MGVDSHKVCKCGSYHSEYICSTGIRSCRACGALLSDHGVFKEDSPCFGMTKEEVNKYFETGVDPRISSSMGEAKK